MQPIGAARLARRRRSGRAASCRCRGPARRGGPRAAAIRPRRRPTRASAKPITAVAVAGQRQPDAGHRQQAGALRARSRPRRSAGSKLSSITAITASRSAMPPSARVIVRPCSCHRLRIGRAAVDRPRRQATRAPAAAAGRRRRGAARRRQRPWPRAATSASAPEPTTSSARTAGGGLAGASEREVVEGRERVTAIALHEKFAMSPLKGGRHFGFAARGGEQGERGDSRRAAPASRSRGRGRRRGRRARR